MSQSISRSPCLVAVAISSLLSIADYAAACSCERPRPPAEELERMGAVFHGRVKAIEEGEFSQLLVTLEVAELWKGPIQESITVTTANNEAACGLWFALDAEYLVYAWSFLDENGEVELHANQCTRTRTWREGSAAHDEEIEALGEPIEVFEFDPVPFVRGDVNADGDVDIADPVSGLSWFFNAGSSPRCLKTLDVDGNNVAEMTDAIFLLNYLFRGGARPVSPFPTCDVDEADVSPDISCRGHLTCEF